MNGACLSEPSYRSTGSSIGHSRKHSLPLVALQPHQRPWRSPARTPRDLRAAAPPARGDCAAQPRGRWGGLLANPDCSRAPPRRLGPVARRAARPVACRAVRIPQRVHSRFRRSPRSAALLTHSTAPRASQRRRRTLTRLDPAGGRPIRCLQAHGGLLLPRAGRADGGHGQGARACCLLALVPGSHPSLGLSTQTLCESCPEAQKLFDIAAGILGYDLLAVCADGEGFGLRGGLCTVS